VNIDDQDFTVICPVYNSSDYITETLESIFAQTLRPSEIIIIDDGSTDDTVSVIERVSTQWKFKVLVINSQHRGPGAARNLGMMKAKSNWIAFIDSDDLWERNKLEMVSDNIILNPLKNIFCHSEYHMYKNGTLKLVNYGADYDYSKDLPTQLYLRNYFSTSATVCKKALIDEYGGFDEKMMNAQDYELWLKISPKGNPFFLEEQLGVYRIRDGNITSRSIEKKMLNLFKIALRYKKYVTKIDFGLKIIQMLLSYIKQKIKRLIGGNV